MYDYEKPTVGIGPRSILFISVILAIATIALIRFVTDELDVVVEQAGNITRKLGADVVERGQELGGFYGEQATLINGSFLVLAILIIIGVELWYLHRRVNYLKPLYKRYSKEQVDNDIKRINTYRNMHPELSKKMLATQLQKQGWSPDIVDAALRKGKKRRHEYRVKLK